MRSKEAVSPCYRRVLIGRRYKIVYHVLKRMDIVVGAPLLYLHAKADRCTYTRQGGWLYNFNICILYPGVRNTFLHYFHNAWYLLVRPGTLVPGRKLAINGAIV